MFSPAVLRRATLAIVVSAGIVGGYALARAQEQPLSIVPPGALLPAPEPPKDAAQPAPQAQPPAAKPTTPPPAPSGPFSALGYPAVVPDFWDPKRRIERPPANAVQAIRFLTTDDFPPFNFVDAGGHLTGFNVDLARAICSELGVPCTIQARQWDDLTNHLADKTADAVIAGTAITAQSRANLDFSDVYLRLPARFVVRRSEAKLDISPEGLRNHTLAVVTGTAHVVHDFIAAFLLDRPANAAAELFQNVGPGGSRPLAGFARPAALHRVQNAVWVVNLIDGGRALGT